MIEFSFRGVIETCLCNLYKARLKFSSLHVLFLGRTSSFVSLNDVDNFNL